MANFSTHLAVGSVASGLAATVAMASGVVPQHHLLTLTLAGIIGSVLPDIDLEKAVPSRILFGALGVVFAFVTLFNFERQYSILELWIVWLGVYLGVRHGVFHAFHRRTTHRGIWHSLLAGVLFAGLTAMLFANVFNEDPLTSWIAGAFVLFGFIVHLALDEFSSVDFEGKRIKKSFGSALKLFDYKSIRNSALMAGCVMVVLSLAPSPVPFVDLVRTRALWSDLQERMLPRGTWFETRMARLDRPARPDGAGDITGSIPRPQPAQDSLTAGQSR
jgi:uncharacterized membrane protein HdeD (DUF308 family)